jgi:hypothetical protein
MAKAPRKKSAVLKKAARPTKKENIAAARVTLSALRTALRGYKQDRVEASKALRAPCAALKSAERAVSKQEKAVVTAAAKLAKLLA